MLSGAGKCSIFIGDDEPVSFESHIIRVRLNLEEALPEFYYYYFRSPNGKAAIYSIVEQGAGSSGVRGSDLARLPVVHPRLSEQREIAHTLGSLDDKIEINRQMNQTLEQMAQAIFKSWFVDFDPVVYKAVQAGNPVPECFQTTAKRYRQNPAIQTLPQHILDLFPDHFEKSELGEIPAGWFVTSLFSMVELIGGGTPSKKIPEYWEGDIPWFSVVDAPSTGDVWVIKTEKTISQAGVDNSSTKVLPAGTTIISARGTVGKCALLGREMAMNQSCYGIRPKDGYSDIFANYLVRTKVNDLQQSGHGSVFNTITRTTFEYIKAIDCGAELSKAFDETARPYLEYILKTLLESDALCNARDLLLPSLISGEIKVEAFNQALRSR